MKLPLPKVCVTFNSTDSRSVIESKLAEIAEVRFLNQIPAEEELKRRQMLLESNILFALQPEKELAALPADQIPRLDFVQFLSAGVDHIDFSHFPHMVPLAGNAGGFAKPIAEHVLAMALSLAKQLPQRHQAMQSGEFDFMSVTGTLRGKTAGIIGYGGIGREVANLLRMLDMEILAINSTGKPQPHVEFTGTLDDLQQVVAASHLLVLCLPLTRATEGVIGAEQLAWLREDAILVNVARGELIDQRALYNCLRDNPDISAGIDAWWVEPFRHGKFKLEYPLLDLPNVLGSPHNSPRSPGAELESVSHATDNIVRFLKAGKVTGLIDLKRDTYRH